MILPTIVKICPFCGGTETTIIRDVVCCPPEFGAWVRCDSCDATGPAEARHETPEEAEAAAIVAWNARQSASEDATDECSCASGWVEDQNWSWGYPDLPQERIPGNGLIRCGICRGPV